MNLLSFPTVAAANDVIGDFPEFQHLRLVGVDLALVVKLLESGTNWGRRLWLAGGPGWPCLMYRVGVHPSPTRQVPVQAPDLVALAA